MARIVRDDGFHPDDLSGAEFAPAADPGAFASDSLRLDLDAGGDARELAPYFPRISVIRIRFGSFEDGRGFSLAHRLRQLGFSGRLRAEGYLIADQYALARRSGFDEVAIPEELAVRQPPDQWRTEGGTGGLSYQSRLKKPG